MQGVVGFDSSTGYWLIHSTPRFPVSGTNSTFPSNERYYGQVRLRVARRCSAAALKASECVPQSFLCISLAAATLNDVGSALRVNAPGFFGSYVPAYLPNLVRAAAAAVVATMARAVSGANALAVHAVRRPTCHLPLRSSS